MATSQLLETRRFTGPACFRNNPETRPEQKPQEEPEEVETVCFYQTLESVIDWTIFRDFRNFFNVSAYCFRVRSRQKSRLALRKWNAPRYQCYSLFKYKLWKRFEILDSKCPREGLTKFERIVSIHGWRRSHPIERPFGTFWIKPTSETSSFAIIEASSYYNDVETSTWRQLSWGYWVCSKYSSAGILDQGSLWNALPSIKHQCVRRKKVVTQPVHPEMADLSKERVNGFSYPFEHTRKDYFGPFEVKGQRKTIKYWCCPFTSLTTRAFHIEVVERLDADACMMALTRFMARRSKACTIVSDNVTKHAGAAREVHKIAKEWNQTLIHYSLAQQSVAGNSTI